MTIKNKNLIKCVKNIYVTIKNRNLIKCVKKLNSDIQTGVLIFHADLTMSLYLTKCRLVTGFTVSCRAPTITDFCNRLIIQS